MLMILQRMDGNNRAIRFYLSIMLRSDSSRSGFARIAVSQLCVQLFVIAY